MYMPTNAQSVLFFQNTPKLQSDIDLPSPFQQSIYLACSNSISSRNQTQCMKHTKYIYIVFSPSHANIMGLCLRPDGLMRDDHNKRYTRILPLQGLRAGDVSVSQLESE